MGSSQLLLVSVFLFLYIFIYINYLALSHPHGHQYECTGQFIREVCHLAMDDMKEVYKRNAMDDGRQNCFLVNKFDSNIDNNAIICAARRIHLQERERYS